MRTRGRAAHSAYAHLGVSAIEPMLALLPTVTSLPLPTDPVLGETTVNIGTIRGGTEANIVPDLCEAELMFRLVGDVAPLRDALTEWAGDRAELEWGSYIPAQHFHTIDGFEVVARGLHLRHPAAQPVGHAAALRSRLDPRGAYDATSSST